MVSTGVKAIQPTFKKRFGYKPPAKWSDEVFHCIFGPTGNHITTAVDLSPINAPISFHGAAEINIGAQAIQSPGPDSMWPSALNCPSNGSYVEVPHNTAYDFGYGDFTIEFFFTPTNVVNPLGPIQLIGVWDGPLIANQSWRIVTDLSYHHFQWIEDGVAKEIKWHNTVPSAANWLKHIWERYMGRLTFQVEWSTGTVEILGFIQGEVIQGAPTGPIFFGHIDPPANPVPLRMGGTPTVAMLGYMKDVRLTRAAQYRGQLSPYQSAPFGYLFPPYTGADDSFPAQRVGQILPDRIIDPDTIFAPVLTQDRVLRPTRIIDVDNFRVPLNQTNPIPPDGMWFSGPFYPDVRPTDVGDFPKLEDITTTSGFSLSATLTLPATRNTNDLLLFVLHVATTNLTANSGYGTSWTFVNGGNTGGGGGLGDSKWYILRAGGVVAIGFRAVDGTEVSPIINFTSGDSLPAYNWRGHVLRFSKCDVATPNWSWPIWDQAFGFAGRNNHVTSPGYFFQQSDDFFDPGPPPIYPNGMHLRMIATNTNEALTINTPFTTTPDPHYIQRLSEHSVGGSLVICSRIEQARNVDNFGSGFTDQLLAEAAVWDSATITLINGPFPAILRHNNTRYLDLETFYAAQVNQGLPP